MLRSNAPSVSRSPLAPRVLVVDDDEAVLRSVSRVLSGNGCRVRVARDGGEALTLMQEQVFDVVLSDVDMPVLDGYGLADTMSLMELDVPVIFISGDASAAAHVVTGPVLQKPVNPDMLNDAIRAAISFDDVLELI